MEVVAARHIESEHRLSATPGPDRRLDMLPSNNGMHLTGGVRWLALMALAIRRASCPALASW
jgi:hypothetical protein